MLANGGMSNQAKAYLQRAATLIELAAVAEDIDLRCELIDTALLYERLADFAIGQEVKDEPKEAPDDHGRS